MADYHRAKYRLQRIRFNQQQSKLQQEYEMLKQMMNAMQVELEATNQAVKHGTRVDFLGDRVRGATPGHVGCVRTAVTAIAAARISPAFGAELD